MAFFDFLRPKWKHSDPVVRKATVENLTDQTLLAQVAKIDSNPSVANVAVAKLVDQALLFDLAKTNCAHWYVSVTAASMLSDQQLLADVAKSPSPDVRKAVVKNPNLRSQTVLGMIAKNDGYADVRNAATEKLTDPAILTEIVRNDSDWEVRRAAVHRLRGISGAGVGNALLAIVQDSCVGVKDRQNAILALGERKEKLAVAPLLAALQGKEPALRWCAAKALGEIGDLSALDPLVAVLQDYDQELRGTAAEAIEEISESQPHERLSKALLDLLSERLVNLSPNDGVRMTGLKVLTRIATSEAKAPLMTALRCEPNRYLREQIRTLLGQLAPSEEISGLGKDLDELDELVDNQEWQKLMTMGDSCVEFLLAKLRSVKDDRTARQIVETLGKIGDKRALRPIAGLLESMERRVESERSFLHGITMDQYKYNEYAMVAALAEITGDSAALEAVSMARQALAAVPKDVLRRVVQQALES